MWANKKERKKTIWRNDKHRPTADKYKIKTEIEDGTKKHTTNFKHMHLTPLGWKINQHTKNN